MGRTFPLFRGVLLGSLTALIVTLLWSGPALRPGEAQSSTSIRIGVVWDPLSPNPFGAYLPEILRAEGWMAYEVRTLAEVSLPILQRYPVVLLAEIPLTPEQATVFRSYVENGGELIAMRPSPNLRAAFGLSIAGTLSEAYLRLDPSHPAGSGLASESMQFHGTGDLYFPEGNEIVARFYSPGPGEVEGQHRPIDSDHGDQPDLHSGDLLRAILPAVHTPRSFSRGIDFSHLTDAGGPRFRRIHGDPGGSDLSYSGDRSGNEFLSIYPPGPNPIPLPCVHAGDPAREASVKIVQQESSIELA